MRQEFLDVRPHDARGARHSLRGRRAQQGIVVYVALEGDKGFRRRIEAYKRHHGLADAPFYLITDPIDLVLLCLGGFQARKVHFDLDY
jgi:hypothetical protein